MLRLSLPSSHFFFNDAATTEIYTLSLHDALPISATRKATVTRSGSSRPVARFTTTFCSAMWISSPLGVSVCSQPASKTPRSEEHTSELQSRSDLVCRLLLEKKNNLGWAEGVRLKI